MLPNQTKNVAKYTRHILTACLTLCVLNGCRLFERDGKNGGFGTGRIKDGGSGNTHGSDVASRDPLFGGRMIPKQDIPIPGKSELASDRDPLLRNASGSANNDRKEPFYLKPENTTAALAGSQREDVPKLDDRKSPTGDSGRVPFKPSTDRDRASDSRSRDSAPLTASLPSLDMQYEFLKRINAKYSEPTRDRSGDYFFTAEVLGSDDLPARRYEGVGSTPAAAVFQVVEQIKSEK
jgi:hypothetical protein